jgi:DNA replication and repair protein RecF
MRLLLLGLGSFRSYRELEFRPDPEINLLVGDNGAGKTNLLEAIAYLSDLRSFRGSPEETLVATGSSSAVVRAAVDNRGGDHLIEIEIKREGPRRLLIDRSRPRRNADLAEIFRVVTFIPEDLEVTKGGPGARRGFFDQAAVRLWPAAAAEQTELERTLRHRNAALKQETDVVLDVWDARLAQVAGRVMARRLRAAHALLPAVGRIYRQVGGSGVVEFGYRSDWGGGFQPSLPAGGWAEMLREALTRSRRKDRERGLTSVGPHRDEPELIIDGRDSRYRASQGEQRTLALALRLAEHAAVAEQIGEPPVLGLDDVFSELDAYRAKALVEALPAAQILITAASPEHVPALGRLWEVAGGRIT